MPIFLLVLINKPSFVSSSRPFWFGYFCCRCYPCFCCYFVVLLVALKLTVLWHLWLLFWVEKAKHLTPVRCTSVPRP
ncbi:unnamed protein product [Meloidogyne enterolobii]|uniref:Uncharacterized protein n=1 Tax=Meloidogyne enterolobii TaxID=390850 RepID=A0ACB0ZYV8_MELEN